MYRIFIALTAALTLLAAPAAAKESLWSAVGGESRWLLSAQALKSLALQPAGGVSLKSNARGRMAMTLPVSPTATLEFDGSLGRFNKLYNGSLLLSGGPVLEGPEGAIDLRGLRLVPLHGTRDTAFSALTSDGRVALTLRYGHFEYLPNTQRLDAHIMDAFTGPAMAEAIGGAGAEGQYLGQVSLALDVVPPADPAALPKGTACGASPNWPTLTGFEANLEMQAIDQISETPTGRDGGRIAITPSAFFRNVGSADLPWYSMFTVPSTDNIVGNEGPDGNDDPDCIDNGSGQCEPYGVDQGGLLVWNVYRLKDGIIEQLGRSAVKHAWNSVNGQCSCRSGRVVGSGCTDLYGVGNNADQDLLGPRSEIQAAPVLWQRTGSIWDNNNDGRCDVLNPSGFPHDASWCRNDAADEYERRLTVQDTDLGDPEARYFLEAWYLVRQDVNIFDSMGYQEIVPTFNAGSGANGLWSFPCAGGACSGTFVNGPALDAFVNDASPQTNETSATQDSAQGRVRLASTVTALPNGRFRYQYSLMNYDLDRGIDGVSLPTSASASVDNTYVTDGDQVATNEWTVTVGANAVTLNAPASGVLQWGSLISFGFDAGSPPAGGSATVAVDGTGLPASFSIGTSIPAGVSDTLFSDSFETP